MSDLTVPDEFEERPFDARRFVLAEANDAVSIREAIDSIVGLDGEEWGSDNALSFTKEEAAALLMALGGPE